MPFMQFKDYSIQSFGTFCEKGPLFFYSGLFYFLFQEEVVCIEKEIIREEVIEEVIEYEYEIRNGVKVCVGERNMGKTVTTQELNIT